MAVAVWVLGDSEEEIRAWLDENDMVPGGRCINGGYRARLMLRAVRPEAEPEHA